jgi:hypothetical protein
MMICVILVQLTYTHEYMTFILTPQLDGSEDMNIYELIILLLMMNNNNNNNNDNNQLLFIPQNYSKPILRRWPWNELVSMRSLFINHVIIHSVIFMICEQTMYFFYHYCICLYTSYKIKSLEQKILNTNHTDLVYMLGYRVPIPRLGGYQARQV